MEDEELRKEIYARLGLEFGSLPSETGNDWQRAKNEVLEEQKKKEFEKLSELKKIDYLTIDKNSDEFNMVINSKSLFFQNIKILIAQRNDLSEYDIRKLLLDGNKDILINLVRYQSLSENLLDCILEKDNVYLTKKYLIENQNLTLTQKEKLIIQMKKFNHIYLNMIKKIEL